MKRCVLGLTLVGFAAAWGAFAADDTITFKKTASVHGGQVRLGDVAEVRGEHAEKLMALEVAPAPPPGRSNEVSAAVVAARMRTAGLDPKRFELQGASKTIATTERITIRRESIADSLRQYIEREMPWDPTNTEIDIPLPTADVFAPDGQVEFTWHPKAQYRYLGQGAFQGAVTVNGVSVQSLLCRATIETYANVLVAVRDIPRGHCVSAADVEMRRTALSSAPMGTLADPKLAVGLIAAKTVFPGQIVTASCVQQRLLVKRNDLVNVEVRVGSMQLQGRAQATMDGRAGDTILCVNPDSKEQLEGVVQPNGSVVVK